MALFKISKGSKSNLPTTLTEGYCWYTFDDSKFYIDFKDENGVLARKALNAEDAEKLSGASLTTILNSSDVEIPTSNAVLNALLNYQLKSDDTLTTEDKTLVGAINEINSKVGAGGGTSTGGTGSSGEKELPDIDPAVDEGKVLGVVGGVWNKITIPTGGSNAGTSQSDIFPYQKVDGFAADASFGGAYSTTSPVSFEIKESETYYVEWDGETYPCECKGGSFNNMPILYLGNDSLLGGTSDEPFTIGYYTMLGVVGFIAADTNPSHDIGIYQIVPAGQPDWAQSDNTQPDYIKNRPFYETLIEQSELLAPTELSFTDSTCIRSVDVSMLNKWLEDWTVARVTWDGVVYECEAQIIRNDKLVGNVDSLVGGDNGLPFLVNCYSIEGGGAVFGVMAVNDETESTHEVSISVLTYSIDHLDTKFIKSIPWKKISDKPFDMTPAGTIVAKGTEDFAMPFDGAFATVVNEITLENNTPYIVEFDGSSYQVTTTSLVTETDASIYYENEGVFFAFFNDFISGSTAIIAPTQGEHTYKITVAEDIVKKIDPVYLPDNLGGLPEVTTADAGKFLRVNTEGKWAVGAILNAEEVAF